MKRVIALTFFLLVAPCAPAGAVVLRDLDFQTPGLLKPDGHPYQWQNYVPENKDKTGTSGITLGSPGVLPYPYTQAARFQPALETGRPRSMAKLAKHSTADPGVELSGPLDAAEGLDRYYLWYTYFPADFDIPPEAPKNAATVIHAWHNDAPSGECNPNSQMHVKRLAPGDDGLRILLRVQGGRYSTTPPKTWTAEGGTEQACFTETHKEIDLGPAVRGRWILFRVHVRWSSNPAKGVTEISRDDELFTIPGANLYRTEGGVIEQGFMEHGIYVPVEPNASGRARSVWSVGMRVATAPEDIVPLVAPPEDVVEPADDLCRSLSARVRRIRIGGGRLVIRIGTRSTADEPAVVRLIGPRVKLRRARISVAVTSVRFVRRRAAIPPETFERPGIHRVRVRVTPRRGRSRSVLIRVRARRCA